MVLKKFFGKKEEASKASLDEIDIESYLSDLSIREGRVIERDDVIYVKPIELDSEGRNIGLVLKEIEKGNIVVLNVKNVLNNKILLRNVVKELKDSIEDIEGDIARLSVEKILLVPNGVRIAHRTPQGEAGSEEAD